MRLKDRVMRFWVIHNAVIHPIMAFLPIEMGDRLHEIIIMSSKLIN